MGIKSLNRVYPETSSGYTLDAVATF